MNKKAKIIASSVAAIALSSSLIAGSTFALFTSDSSVNIAVTAAKVKVEAKVDKSYNEVGYIAESSVGDVMVTPYFNDKDELVLGNIAVGDSVKVKIDVTNYCSISVLYKAGVNITDAEGDNLSEYLKVDVESAEGVSYDGVWRGLSAAEDENGDSLGSVYVTVSLPEAEGVNEHQGESCTVSFCVEAIQGNVDADDLNATHVTQADVYEYNGWNWLVNSGLVKLDADIDTGNAGLGIQVPQVNLNGKTVTSGQLSVPMNFNTEIYGGTIAHSDEHHGVEDYVGQHTLYIWDGANVTLRDVTIQAKEIELNNYYSMFIQNFEGAGATKVVIDGDSVVNGAIGLQGDGENHPVYLTLNGGTFNHKEGAELPFIDTWPNSFGYNVHIEINGGKFNCIKLAQTNITKDELVIKGGKFKCDPTSWVADGYKAVLGEDGYYTVIADTAA